MAPACCNGSEKSEAKRVTGLLIPKTWPMAMLHPDLRSTRSFQMGVHWNLPQINSLKSVSVSLAGLAGKKASWNIPIIGRNLSKSKQIPCLLGFFGLSQSVFFRFDRKPAARDRADNLV